MPEIGEVARAVNRLRTYLVGKSILKVTTVNDPVVFKDTTHEIFKKALEGKKVLGAKQWGKYLWLVMDSPPHPIMHFGMAGWIYVKNDPKPHYNNQKPLTDWPPKYLIFNLHVDADTEIAFADPRRLARIRLIDHEDGNDLRNVLPLKRNGPDPVLEPIALEWFTDKLRKRSIPVKTWLLDQSMIAGVGNWVGDEILWNAKIHPNTKTNTLTDVQIAELHRALLYVTKFAVDVEADSSKFPGNWLMLHRWRLGKKTGGQLPTGEKVEFVKVGGRTSAFVQSVQGGEVSGVVPEKKVTRPRKRTKEEAVKGDEESEFEEMGREAKAKGWVLKRAKVSEESEFEEMRRKARAKGWVLKRRQAVGENIVGEENFRKEDVEQRSDEQGGLERGIRESDTEIYPKVKSGK